MALGGTSYVDLTLDRAAKYAPDESTRELLTTLSRRVGTVRAEQDVFRTWCNRADLLYYSTDFTDGGADLWPTHPSATTPGRSHVSINTPSVYVDVPASLQAVDPIENFLSTKDSKEAREAAADMERIYTAWKASEDFDLKFHKACTVKALYGRTAGRVVWDDDDGGNGHPEVEIIEQPRNLYLGYQTDAYDELEWAAYVMRYDPNALIEEYGVDIMAKQNEDGTVMPLVSLPPEAAQTINPARNWLTFGDARIEVWDYWYRKPVWKNGKFSKMVTCNAVFAGNIVLRGPTEYSEYGGDLPYVPLLNTFIPGMPTGRSELHDTEPLIREKFEKVTAGSQMIANGVAGDYWQLVGPEAPTRIPATLKPTRNAIIGPGPGNRIETITPYIAQFQLEQYLSRLDRELASVSGLNDLLLGLAPAQVLSSSKAINALIANYESRLAIRRKLLYSWRKALWELVITVWAKKDRDVKAVVANGGGFLDITDPSLSPRDDMETAQRALNLMNGKVWSQRRAMDATGVDDPETEQDMIREERTDATMFPAEVQVMAQLLGALQTLGLNTPPGVQQQGSAAMAQGQEDLRKALGQGMPVNTTGMQSPETVGQQPPIPGAPPQAGGEQAPTGPMPQGPAFATPPGQAGLPGMPGGPPVLRQTIQGGQVKSQIRTQQSLGRR